MPFNRVKPDAGDCLLWEKEVTTRNATIRKAASIPPTTKTMNKAKNSQATITINFPMEIVPASVAKQVKSPAWVIADRITANEALREVHAEQKELIKVEVQEALKAGVKGEEIREALKLAGWSKQDASDLLIQYGIVGRAKDNPKGKRAVKSAIINDHAEAVRNFVKGLTKNKVEKQAILARAYKLEREAK